MVKLFLNQIVMSVFGTVLCLSTSENTPLLVASGILSICMLLFIDYTFIWELGAKDKIRIDGNRLTPNPYKGALIALCGNIPNILLALLIGIGAIVNTAAGQSVAFVCNFIIRLLNGMYLGIFISIYNAVYPGSEGTLLVKCWWWFLIMTLPVILIGFLAYYLGSKGTRISVLLGLKKPTSDNGENYR